MTRTASTISCKQFDKMCFCYPVLNTNWYPISPHTCVDGDTRPINKSSLPSREASSLCEELGNNYAGPMGSAGNNGVQIRSAPNPSPGKETTCAAPLQNRPCPDNRGGARIASQTGYQGNTNLSQQLHIPTFPCGKERGWAETSGQFKSSEQLCALRALQDGRPPYSARSDSDWGLHDQTRSERCISSDSNPSGPPTSPPISVGGKDIPVHVPSLWSDVSSKGIYEGAQATTRNASTGGDSVSGLPGRHSYPPSEQGGVKMLSSSDLQPVRSSGFGNQYQKIHTDSPTSHRIPGVSDKFGDSTDTDATGEAEENSARCQMVAATSVSHNTGSSPLRGQNHSFIQSGMASPPTLQGNPGLDELSTSRGRGQLSSHMPVQYQASPVSGSTTRPTLVGIPRTDYTITSPPSTTSSQHDYHFRCLQHRLGSMLGGHNYWGDMVSTGDDAPHQLPGALCCISSSAMLSERREQYDHPSQVGQRDSSHLYQSDGRNSLQAFVPTSTCLVGMVHSEEPVPTCRTSTRSAECTGRPRIPKPQGSMRLDDQSTIVSLDTRSNGPLSSRSVCFSPDSATAQILQLENRSRSGGSGCLHTGLVIPQGVCQPPLVPNPSMPQSGSCSKGQADIINSTVAISIMVSSGTGYVGGHTSTTTNSGRSYITPPRAGVSNAPGMPKPGCMAYLRESFLSRGVSQEASNLLLSSWRPKTQSSYNSAFSKWASWCQQRNRDPTFGPIEDIVNFLSESFAKGFQYRSLNSYRSAISAIHSKVDGYSVGQHPLVSRLLRGAFNERPPLPRYSSFWNVDVVLAHLRGLGSNGSLSLKDLTLKTVMLMALARPARSADLANLDIRHQSITDKGIVFSLHICPSRVDHQNLFSTSFTQGFQRMRPCVRYRHCWHMRNAPQHSGHHKGIRLFFFFHGLGNMTQCLAVLLLGG